MTSEVGTNNKIVAGADGNMWVTLNDPTKGVARITPAGEVKEFELPGVKQPSGIAAGPEGDLWLTQEGGVAKFSPSDPVGTTKTTPISEVKANASIVAGPDGNMWVATSEQLIHFPPSNPEGFKALEIPKLSPHDIDVAGSLLVIADAGNSRIVTVTTSGVEKDYPLLGTESTSQGIAGSPTGQIGFAESTTPEGVGLITPPNSPKVYEMAGDPFGAALGSDGAFWIALSAKDGLERVTPDGQTSFLGGFPPKFFPRQIASGPDNTLWVTMEIPGEDVFEVARISGLEPPLTSIPNPPMPQPLVPQTSIVKGPKHKLKITGKRAKVRFQFTSTIPGSSFECALTSLRKPKQAKAPTYHPCASPKHLKLKAGKYRFLVRAISAGVIDPSPATRSFRIIPIRR